MNDHIAKPSHPKKDIENFPLPPYENLMGDAVSDAYDAMMSARNAALAKYEPDNTQQAADSSQYNTDLAAYNFQVAAGTLVNPNKATVFTAMGNAYGAWNTEWTKITNTFDNLAAGDASRQAGLDSNDPMTKIMKYQTARNYYNIAASRCTDAENAHASFVTNISVAENILY